MSLFGDDNVSIANLILFILSVIGFTHIIVDPATIMKPFRDFASKYCFNFLNKLLSCYQCCGTWVGFICGFILISNNIFVVFMCGMAGSFLATWGATYLNYLEARTIISVEGSSDES